LGFFGRILFRETYYLEIKVGFIDFNNEDKMRNNIKKFSNKTGIILRENNFIINIEVSGEFL
jgi:hypothetical protein